MTAPRFVPGREFPAYAFVPGRLPHPESDPAGHHYGIARPPAEEIDPQRWQSSETYLYGIDLFNAGFYWESHVEWESLWIAAGRRGLTADFLKGLIKLAAAGVKHREDRDPGVRSAAKRSAELFGATAQRCGEPVFLGLRLAELIAQAEAIGRDGWPGEPPLLLPDMALPSDAGSMTPSD
jgi:hypothetical protein